MIIFCGLFAAVSRAFAQSWMPTGVPNDLWASVASSADGTRLVVAGVTGSILTSTNSGATWASNNVPSEHWFSVASSADGTKLVALNFEGLNYTSGDAGATWTSNNVPANWWTSAACSADGNKLVALTSSGSVYTSPDSGTTWASNSLPVTTEQCFLVASSADGAKLLVAGDLGPVCLSTNSGTTWALVTNAPAVPWQAVASSADGSKLVLAGRTNLIFTSSDSGITWKSNGVSGVTFWTGVAASADGNKLFALAHDGPTYTSSNSGETWTELADPPNGGLSIVSSAEGARLVLIPGASYFDSIITIFVGDIYTFYSQPSPSLDLTPSGNQLRISWLVPSTNFVLQQNSDLATADWVTLTNTPTLNLTNVQDEVTLSPTNSLGFFRLVTQ